MPCSTAVSLQPCCALQAPPAGTVITSGGKYNGKTIHELLAELEKRDKEKDAEPKKKTTKQLLKDLAEREAAQAEAQKDEPAELTAAEMAAQRAMAQQREEQADLEVAMDLFGGADEKPAGAGSGKKKGEDHINVVLFEAMEPKTKADFAAMTKVRHSFFLSFPFLFLFNSRLFCSCRLLLSSLFAFPLFSPGTSG